MEGASDRVQEVDRSAVMQKRDVEDIAARTARMLEYENIEEEEDDDDDEYESDEDYENDDDDECESEDELDEDESEDELDEDEEESVAAQKKKCCACSKRVVRNLVRAAAYGETVQDFIGVAIKYIGGREGIRLRERLGDLNCDHVFVKGDGLCRLCASYASVVVRDSDVRLNDHLEKDMRRLAIFATYVRDQCHGELPRQGDSVRTLPGWNDPDSGAVDARIGQWWWDVTRNNDDARLRRMRETGDEATIKTLEYLDKCKPREKYKTGSAPKVEEDMRRLAIFATYVRDQCHGELPLSGDSVCTLPGWNDPDSGAVDARIGQWWWDVTRNNDGARLRRMRESGDEATMKTLEYLDKCKPREYKSRPAPRVQEDMRRLPIFAMYVESQMEGQLPLATDSAPTLPGWNDPDAVAVDVSVGEWWKSVTRRDDGARLRRMRETGDEATIKTLEYLDKCKPREKYKTGPAPRVQEDMRRLAIFATYVRDQCHGELPRQHDSVPTLPGWDDPGNVAVDARVGPWWSSVTQYDDGARLRRMRETGDEATIKTLEYLDKCEPRPRRR